MRKVLLVSHVSGFIPQFEMNNVRILQSLGCEVHYASNFENPSYGDDNRRLEGTGIICHQIDFVRSPYSLKNLTAYRQLKRLMEEYDFALVHCHNPISAVLTRISARATRTAPVIYTAHGFHFYKGAPLHMWLFYGTMEWILSFLTSGLICINQEDYEFARRHFHCRRVDYVPGVGIDTGKIRGNYPVVSEYLKAAPGVARCPEFTELRAQKRRELGISSDAFVMISAGELIPRKNHETAIRAVAVLKDRIPSLRYLICGHGELQANLKKLTLQLGISDRVIFAGYRKDLYDLYRAADLCVFPSLQEGLPVALLEAMALGLPVICSDIRGNRELIENNRGGVRLSPRDYRAFSREILRFAKNKTLCISAGEENVCQAENFTEEKTKHIMQKLYRGWLRTKITGGKGACRREI